MANINLGLKIRELRKKRGITQEALASALSVSPQAVSKWESGLTYPDISMMPIIAGYFEVSLDTLFDYDLKELKSKIKKIIKDANVYFFSDTKRYIEMIKTALAEYPGNEELTFALLDGYEYDLREKGNRSRLDEMIEISQRIITESGNYVKVCSVKDVQAAAYLEKGEYEKAKTVLESLPAGITLQYDAVSFRLSGKDKLNAAINARCEHLQSLYQACFQEGNAWLEMDEKKILLGDTPFED
ncbi:MAG: helix-turn-helix transcriptional regulator, partial [Clostridia bacterium]|nr:helix-turn-helix transcriptional regulator [Clostridia bacterium]